MYYITNKKNQIIAIDEALLNLLGFDTIENLQKKIAREELSFETSIPDELTINTDTESHVYDSKTIKLTSMFGSLSLHIVKTQESESLQSDESSLADEALAAALREEEETLTSDHRSFISDEDETIEVAETEDTDISLQEGSEEEPFSIVEEEKEEEEAPLSLHEEPFSIVEEEKEEEEALISLHEEPFSIVEEEKEEEEALISLHEEPFSIVEEEKEEEEALISLHEEPFSIVEEEKEEEEALISLHEEPFSIVEEEKEEAEDTGISITEEHEEKEETPLIETPEQEELELTPIIIDVEKISRAIGISSEDYVSFLNEFIEEAIALEKSLQSIDLQQQSNALHALERLANVLHLSDITEILHQIEQSTSQEKVEQVEILYNTLARLTAQPAGEEIAIEEPSVSLEIEEEPELSLVETEEVVETPETEEISIFEAIEEPKIEAEEEIPEAEEAIEEPKIEAEEEIEEELPEGSFGLLTMKDLNEVKPIHFDFRLEEAADELSLPVELIEEFVHDFLVQAREETIHILEAYRAGDLDRIQKIGHLLKGASSNLRINPLADTLYEIQFCEDPSQLNGLIKNYWAHFVSFEKQMKMTSK